MTTRVETADVAWPAPSPIPSERVLAGSPAAQTVVLADTETAEAGLWRVTAGDFTSLHEGYVEVFQVLDGRGRLIEEGGASHDLFTGVSVTMEDGWSGRWVVEEPLIKSYTLLRGER